MIQSGSDTESCFGDENKSRLKGEGDPEKRKKKKGNTAVKKKLAQQRKDVLYDEDKTQMGSLTKQLFKTRIDEKLMLKRSNTGNATTATNNNTYTSSTKANVSVYF